MGAAGSVLFPRSPPNIAVPLLNPLMSFHDRSHSPPIPASRTRWVPTDAQRRTLEAQYEIGAFPDLNRRNTLAAELGLQARQVQVWFQNRRQKDRTRERASGKIDAPGAMLAPPAGSHVLLPTEGYHHVPKSSDGMIAMQQEMPVPVVGMRTSGLYTDAACPRPLPPNSNALMSIEKMQLELLKNQQQIQQAQRQIQQTAIQLAAPASSPAVTPAMALGPPGPYQIRDAMPLSTQLSSQFSHLVRSARKPARAIAKPPKFGGVPMDRRAVSMDALEVLSSGFM